MTAVSWLFFLGCDAALGFGLGLLRGYDFAHFVEGEGGGVGHSLGYLVVGAVAGDVHAEAAVENLRAGSIVEGLDHLLALAVALGQNRLDGALLGSDTNLPLWRT